MYFLLFIDLGTGYGFDSRIVHGGHKLQTVFHAFNDLITPYEFETRMAQSEFTVSLYLVSLMSRVWLEA